MIIPTKPENTTLSIGDKTIYTLEDLQNYFFLDDVIKHFQSSELHKWCKDNYYVEQVKKLYNISANSTHTEVIKQLIFIFAIKNVFTSKTDSIDADEYLKNLEQNIKEQVIIQKYLSDVNNVKKIVYDYLQKPEHKEEIRKQFFENNNNTTIYDNYDTTAFKKYAECRKLLVELSDIEVFLNIPMVMEISADNINKKLLLLKNDYLNETKTFIKRASAQASTSEILNIALAFKKDYSDASILRRIKRLASVDSIRIYKNNEQLFKNLGF